MKIEITDTLSQSEKLEICHIWNSVYPAQIVYKSVEDFEKYLGANPNPTHLVIKESLHVVGWMCIFDRNGERWFSLLVESSHQKKGIGAELLTCAQNLEPHLSGWIVMHNEYTKTDGTSYMSPWSFYKNFGFELTEERLKTDVLSTVRIKWSQK